MKETYYTISQDGQNQIEIKKSKFGIILIILSLIILGCAAGKETKQVICRNSFYAVNGWVSAENSQSYWVVDSQGKTMEFSKNNCSIKG